MKRTIAFLLTFMMIFSMFGIAAFAEDGNSINFTITANDTTKTVTINGTITQGAGKYVSVKVIDPLNNIEYLDQVICKTDNTFYFTYKSTNLTLDMRV
jgi:hypothetical protein